MNNYKTGTIEKPRHSALIWYILCQLTGINNKDIRESHNPNVLGADTHSLTLIATRHIEGPALLMLWKRVIRVLGHWP